MSCNYYQIINYNNVQSGFYKLTGCTSESYITEIKPLNSDFVCGDNVFVESYGAPLSVVNIGMCPSTTPTPSFTPTPTQTSHTQTPTPTPTVTPTVTPSTPPPIYMYNLWTGGWYQNVCQASYFGNPANVTVYTLKPFSSLQTGDHVYGNKQLTIPPVDSNFTISNGGIFIQLNGTLIINRGLCG